MAQEINRHIHIYNEAEGASEIFSKKLKKVLDKGLAVWYISQARLRAKR